VVIGQFTLILGAFRFSLGSTKFFSPSEGPEHFLSLTEDSEPGAKQVKFRTLLVEFSNDILSFRLLSFLTYLECLLV
jgi:hypothetical protein